MWCSRPVCGAALLAALLVASGCSGNKANKRESDTALDEAMSEDEPARRRGETSVTVVYGETAAENWTLGERELADENYLAAQKYYQYIKNTFPYSALATKAELRVADCLYLRERWLEAIDAYTNFVRIHPSHEENGYATFKVGEAYARMIPEDWFFLPPASEKDQASIRDAARALQSYVDRYPKDAWIADGKKRLAEVRGKLVAHERAIATFYKRIDKPRAWAGRLEVIRSQYGDVGLDDALLAELVEAWGQVPDRAKAELALADLRARFPGSPRLAEAEAVLALVPTSTLAAVP